MRLDQWHFLDFRDGTERQLSRIFELFNHRSMGNEKPVFGLFTTLEGNAFLGAFANGNFFSIPIGLFTKAGARDVSRVTSTNGVLNSSECAMLAQSLSRSSWLRR